ncbi:MAG: hypothetical protein RRZ93_05825 [Ruthenibacterium sp.]
MRNADFLWGMGICLVVGSALDMLFVPKRNPMKTSVGKSIQKAGLAVDHATQNLLAALEK